MTCDFDVVLEPVGTDLASEAGDGGSSTASQLAGCGNCGCSDGGCGSGAGRQPGAGADAPVESAARGCATAAHSACASCGISRLRAARMGGRVGVDT
jgi:hypothetical protein